MPGNFLPGDNDLPGSQTWQPRRAVDTPYSKHRKPRCSYFQYSSSEVLECGEGWGSAGPGGGGGGLRWPAYAPNA